MPAPAPDLPPVKEYEPQQHEFGDERDREVAALADAMRATAGPMRLVGVAFAVLASLTVTHAARGGGSYGPAVGLFAAAVLCLVFGFWTSGAATSFRRVVETKDEDVWHLTSALRSLRAMYGAFRTLILGALVLAAVAAGLVVFGLIGT